MTQEDLHDAYNFRPFLEAYAGRKAQFTYIGGGLVHVELEDGEDITIVDDDEIDNLMGHAVQHEVRVNSPVTFVLQLK